MGKIIDEKIIGIENNLNVNIMKKYFFSDKSSKQNIKNATELSIFMYILNYNSLESDGSKVHYTTQKKISEKFIELKNRIYTKSVDNYSVIDKRIIKNRKKVIEVDPLYKRDFSDEISANSKNNKTNKKHKSAKKIFCLYLGQESTRKHHRFILDTEGIEIAGKIIDILKDEFSIDISDILNDFKNDLNNVLEYKINTLIPEAFKKIEGIEFALKQNKTSLVEKSDYISEIERILL